MKQIYPVKFFSNIIFYDPSMRIFIQSFCAKVKFFLPDSVFSDFYVQSELFPDSNDMYDESKIEKISLMNKATNSFIF